MASTTKRVHRHSRDFGAKTVLFENRIAEYYGVFEKRKRKKVRFAAQKAKNVYELERPENAVAGIP